MSSNDTQPEVPAELGDEVGGHGRVYFDNVVIDNMLDALLELTASVWTYHDRVNVLEQVLAAKGIDVASDIESYLPDEADIVARAAERKVLVERVFGSFIRRPTGDLPGLKEGQ